MPGKGDKTTQNSALQETENVTDELKAHDQMAWIQAVNNIYNRAEEIVIHELVLQ